MARVEIPVGRREAKAKSRFVSSQSLVNAFVERDPDAGEAVYGGPGLTEFADCANGEIRGMHWFNGVLLAVSGDTLFTVDTDGNETSRGAVAGYDPVIIANNGFQAAIVSDSTSYLIDTSNAFNAINDPDFRRATSVDFLKQILAFSEFDSGRYFTSELADAEAYNALDIATAESKPDKLVRIFADADELLLFGERGVEGVYFSGKPDGVPLSASPTNLAYGLIGRMAVTSIDNTVGWLAHDKTVRTLREASPIAIADPAITTQIQGWADASLTRAFTISIRGHEWMVLRNPDGCVMWDATTQMWSSRESYGLSTWRAGSAVWAYDKQLLGDAINGKIWRLDPDSHAEGPDPLVRKLISRTLGPGGAPFTLESVELEVEAGVGIATGQGSDPKIWMQLSRDSGHTYGALMERSLGASGERNKRIIWQGPYGDFPPHGGVIKFGISDPVRFVATKCWAEYTVNMP